MDTKQSVAVVALARLIAAPALLIDSALGGAGGSVAPVEDWLNTLGRVPGETLEIVHRFEHTPSGNVDGLPTTRATFRTARRAPFTSPTRSSVQGSCLRPR